MNPAVITSRAAQNEYDKIVGNHAELLDSLANHAVKVAGYRQQKAAEMANENSMRMEMQKETMANNTKASKNAMDFAAKQAQTDIKRASMANV